MRQCSAPLFVALWLGAITVRKRMNRTTTAAAAASALSVLAYRWRSGEHLGRVDFPVLSIVSFVSFEMSQQVAQSFICPSLSFFWDSGLWNESD